MISMPGKTLVCKKCGGISFKQVDVNSWQCTNCGKIKRIVKHRNVSVERKQIPKESITTSSKFKPLAIYCDKCGQKIGRVGHPNDQKRLTNQWRNHTCMTTSRSDNFYT